MDYLQARICAAQIQDRLKAGQPVEIVPTAKWQMMRSLVVDWMQNHFSG